MSWALALSANAGDWDSSLAISLSWGINPSATGTALYADTGDGAETPFDAEAFANSGSGTRRFALLCIGDGTWIDGEGWADAKWIETEPRTRDTSTGLLWVRESAEGFNLPVTWFGAWSALPDEDRAARLAGAAADKKKASSVDAEDWAKRVFYEETWRSHRAAMVVVEEETRNAWVLAEVPGLEAFELGTQDAPLDSAVGVYPLEITSQIWVDKIFGGGIKPNPRNIVVARLSTPSGKAYIGAKLPRKCIWMADFGLTQDELSKYPKSIVRRAIESWLHPGDPSLQATIFMLR